MPLVESPAASDAPGPRPVPVLGWRANAARFLGDPIAYMDALPAARGVVPFVAGGCPPVLLRGSGVSVFALGAECNRAVLGDMDGFHSQPMPGPEGSWPRLTAGLFSMNAGKHAQQRRLLQPAFHKRRIEGYWGAMVEHAARMLEGWAPGETRDLLLEMQRLASSVATSVLFGISAEDDTLALGARILEVIRLAMSPAAMLSPDLPGTPRRRLALLSAEVERGLRGLVERKRASDADDPDVLAALVRTRDEAGDALSESELIGQTFLLFFAGHDTTRNALAWTLLLLSQHPRIAQDLADELAGVLRGGAPTLEQLARLPLLDAAVKESLRLFPPAPFTPRLSMRPTTLAGRELPAGSEVILSYYHTHRDPDVFPDPTRFLPERWSSLSPSPFEYVPFGAGARQCIGAGFASLEIRVVLAMLLQRFRPVLAPGARVGRHTSIVLTPHPGLPMALHPVGSTAPPPPTPAGVAGMVAWPA